MALLLVDDHLLRGVLAQRPVDLARDARDRGELATTELYYHRLCASYARPEIAGRLSAPLAQFDPRARARFRERIAALPDDIISIPIRSLAWRMAEIRERFHVSTLVAEVLASAENLSATIAVDQADLGPRMQFAALELHVELVTVAP